ncbi:MAG TPA: phenylalanine--tRNA ligase subunit beta [candidate division Zixibacteria bacterium]|nr:phenylalanine--tRNA ligase subunit beta [candidate division Zixibacteria bacterium]
MPTIDIDYADFERLLGMELHKDLDKINELLAFVKGEAKLFNEKEGTISLEIKDTNRPDIWNIEGLVRALRGFLGFEEGLRQYAVGKQSAKVHVDQGLENIRPYIGCSIVKNLRLTDSMIRGFMHMQDKLDQTYGRNRRRTSIGLYNLDLIKLPLQYTVAKPEEVSFVPLGFTEEMNLKEILAGHPKGLEYGNIVSKHEVYPILLDAEDKPLSFPPIINSNDLGRITENTRNILVEVTGTMEEAVLNTLKIVTLSLIDRGGEAYAAKIHYPHRRLDVVTPSFEPGQMDLNVDYTNRVLGLQLKAKQIAQMLRKAGHGAEEIDRNQVDVQIPCYRIDVMHPIDLVEDVAIAYDYNNIKPLWREMPTTGRVRPEQGMIDVARELMIGLEFQEVLTYSLTNPENLFKKMNLKKERIVEISNPKVITLTCLRNWLLPSLIEFVSNNLHVECPQKLFELGKVTLPDEKKETRTRDEERLAAVIYDANASFTQVKSTLEAFMKNFGLEWQIRETEHPSFINGRACKAIVKGTEVGILGEINPKVLETWKLENPTAAFELDIERIVKIKQKEQ